jgi:hypothetical protein
MLILERKKFQYSNPDLRKFTDFCSKFTCRVFGGVFSVKVAAEKRNKTTHYP